MGETTQLSKWGDGLALRIPPPIVEQWGVKEGAEIEIVSCGNQLVLKKKPFTLEALVEQINPENAHAEVDSGPAVGAEKW